MREYYQQLPLHQALLGLRRPAPARGGAGRHARGAHHRRGHRAVGGRRPRSSSKGSRLAGNEAVIAAELLKEIRSRLGFLLDVGLGYLTLDRPAPSLSGGESQRIRLASQLGSELTGVIYVLDEPSIGLHQRDNRAARTRSSACATSATRWSWSSTTRGHRGGRLGRRLRPRRRPHGRPHRGRRHARPGRSSRRRASPAATCAATWRSRCRPAAAPPTGAPSASWAPPSTT